MSRGTGGVAERQDNRLVEKVWDDREAKRGKGNGENERKGASDENGKVTAKVGEPPE